MKKMKGIFCVFLALSLSTALFAKGSQQNNPEGTKIIRALVPNQGGVDLNDGAANPVHLLIQERTGYTVTYDTLPADRPNDKLNAILAAGAADYDYISLYAAGKEQYAQYASQGALMDMALLFKNTKYISQLTPKALIDAVTVGDTFYCIPGLAATGRTSGANADNFLLIRTDLLNALGLKMPTTLDEFTAMLQAFKDRDTVKAGSANAPLTVTMANLNNLRSTSIGGAFGVELNWSDQGGTLVPYQTQDGFFEFLQYLRELYVKGLMDPEMPTNNGAAVREKFTTNKALVRVDGWWDIPALLATFKASYPAASMEFIQPLSRNGKVGAAVSSINQVGFFTFIPRASKTYQTTMDFLDKKMEPELFKETVIGKEGIDYTVNAQGGYDPILPTFFDHRANGDKYVTATSLEYGNYWLARAKKDENQYKVFSQVNYDYDRFLHVDPSTDIPCADFVKISSTQVNSDNLTLEFMVNAVVSGIARSSFDAFVTDWKKQCGNDLIAAYNSWYKGR